jgi:hypothetical protein
MLVVSFSTCILFVMYCNDNSSLSYAQSMPHLLLLTQSVERVMSFFLSGTSQMEKKKRRWDSIEFSAPQGQRESSNTCRVLSDALDAPARVLPSVLRLLWLCLCVPSRPIRHGVLGVCPSFVNHPRSLRLSWTCRRYRRQVVFCRRS